MSHRPLSCTGRIQLLSSRAPAARRDPVSVAAGRVSTHRQWVVVPRDYAYLPWPSGGPWLTMMAMTTTTINTGRVDSRRGGKTTSCMSSFSARPLRVPMSNQPDIELTSRYERPPYLLLPP